MFAFLLFGFLLFGAYYLLPVILGWFIDIAYFLLDWEWRVLQFVIKWVGAGLVYLFALIVTILASIGELAFIAYANLKEILYLILNRDIIRQIMSYLLIGIHLAALIVICFYLLMLILLNHFLLIMVRKIIHYYFPEFFSTLRLPQNRIAKTIVVVFFRYLKFIQNIFSRNWSQIFLVL